MTIQELKNIAIETANNSNELMIKPAQIVKTLKTAGYAASVETVVYGKGCRITKKLTVKEYRIKIGDAAYEKNVKNFIEIARFLAANIK